MNLAAVIREHAATRGDKIAVYFRDERVSYADLWQLIESIAAFLYAKGIRAGDRVGLCMAEHPRHLAAHFAVARLSAVIVPMDHRWSDTEKSSITDAFHVDLVLTDDDTVATQQRPELPAMKTAESELLISLSSGTTGRPKGAVVSHRNLYERFVSQWHAIGYGENDCFAVLTPFYFGAGRSFGMSLLCAGGAVMIAPPPLTPSEIVDVLQHPHVTATFLPPTLMRRLFPLHREGEKPLFPNIQYLIASGEPLFAEEADTVVRALTPNLYSYYASSEGGGITVLRSSDFPRFADTVGQPTYKTEVQIVDALDAQVDDGVVGRLRYRGPGVATQYLDADGNLEPGSKDGWFYPGDLAERLESGHIALRGRDKDVIIRGGVNIYPAELEAQILTCPGVDEIAVIGIDDKERGQVIAAFFAGTADVAAVAGWCKENLAPYKVPQRMDRIEALPKRSSGKIDKRALVRD